MDDVESKLSDLLDLAEALSIEVRRAHLGGEGGGLCVLKGRRVLFLDADADLASQFDRTLRDIAHLPEIDEVFIKPELREDVDRVRVG